MTKRKSLTKKVRFEVFKRDGFTCAYCGSTPPNVNLEVDHIRPVSKGGGNDIDNLITSCFDCNRGKSNVELTSVPKTVSEKLKESKEREEQYLEFKKHCKKIEARINKEVSQVEDIYNSHYDGWLFSDKFKLSVKRFIKHLGHMEVADAMEKACNRWNLDEQSTLTYFCGICWNKLRGDE